MEGKIIAGTLLEYAAATASKSKCASCAIRAARPDLWAEVLAARAKPVPIPLRTCAGYLTTQGCPIGESALTKHFAAGHEHNGGAR